MKILFAALICLGLAFAPRHSFAQQWPPTKLENVKVLPADIPIRALVDTMAGFTRALGVRCTYCHVGKESDPLDKYDFVSDSLPTKVKAREMMRMVLAINGDHLARLAARREPRITVTCETCHRGITAPRTLQQILLTAYDAAGIDSTIAAYRALRERYYGSSAYDFDEVALGDVGGAVFRKGKPADALRLHLLNVESVPRSTFALRQAAQTQLALRDTAAAIASYEKALVINPNDAQSKAALERLKRRP
jgi:tetratricopeptide (TPR) repeat protein